MPFEIIRNDITKVTADAIVNAANTQLRQGGGVCGAIFAAAGAHALQAECDAIGRCTVGGAVITKGYNLPAEYVIHTVGPIVYYEVTDALRQDLKNCYENVLRCCMEHQIRSVAFCCISTGEFHFPQDEAAQIAIQTVQTYQKHSAIKVIFNVFQESDERLYQRLLGSHRPAEA